MTKGYDYSRWYGIVLTSSSSGSDSMFGKVVFYLSPKYLSKDEFHGNRIRLPEVGPIH